MEIKKVTNERHSLPLLYIFGWGTPIYLQHRNIYDFDTAEGDKIEIWSGASATYENILTNDQWYDMDYDYGRLYLRGFIFSILRQNRVRVTYRYGGEGFAGDTTIPGDIEDCVIKMVALEFVNTSFRMDKLPMGSAGVDYASSKRQWTEDIETCIENRREVFPIT